MGDFVKPIPHGANKLAGVLVFKVIFVLSAGVRLRVSVLVKVTGAACRPEVPPAAVREIVPGCWFADTYQEAVMLPLPSLEVKNGRLPAVLGFVLGIPTTCRVTTS